MMLPSRRWFVGAVMLGLLHPLALLNSGVTSWLFLADLLWVVAWLIDAWRITPIDLANFPVSREPPPAFSLGRPLPVRYHWENPLPRSLSLEVRETIAALVDCPGSERHLLLPPGGKLSEELLCQPHRRGKAETGRMTLRVMGPWGLAVRQGDRQLPWSLTVYPSLRTAAMQALQTPAQRRREAGFRNLRQLGAGRVFESLREWVPGDETRIIDWKATARRGKTMARQYEDERRQQMLIAIDAGRMLTAETDGIARLESAVQAALELTHAAVSHDDDVGLVTFADEIIDYLPPTRGRRGLRQVLDVLAGLSGRMVEPDYPAVFAQIRARTRKRTFTVLFTDVIDRTASEAFLSYAATLRPRHLPLAVTLREPALEQLTTTVPRDYEIAFQRAAAEELLQARGQALHELRSAGVLVLDVPPQDAARAVVNQYEMLKLRAAI